LARAISPVEAVETLHEEISNAVDRRTRVTRLGCDCHAYGGRTRVGHQRHFAPCPQVTLETELETVRLIVVDKGAKFGCDEQKGFEGIHRERLDREAGMIDRGGFAPWMPGSPAPLTSPRRRVERIGLRAAGTQQRQHLVGGSVDVLHLGNISAEIRMTLPSETTASLTNFCLTGTTVEPEQDPWVGGHDTSHVAYAASSAGSETSTAPFDSLGATVARISCVAANMTAVAPAM